MYCRNYKQVPLEQSYGLLRRAYRLDQALKIPPPSASIETEVTGDICSRCGSTTSPYFWPAPNEMTTDDSKPPVVCHRCHWGHTSSDRMDVDPRPVTNGHHASEPPPILNGNKPEPPAHSVGNGVIITSYAVHQPLARLDPPAKRPWVS